MPVESPAIHVFLWALASEINLGLIIRDCYTLGDGVVSLNIFDPEAVIRRNRDAIGRFSNYSFERYQSLTIYEYAAAAEESLAAHRGRLISLEPDEQRGTCIHEFSFQSQDVLLFGNENSGLPPGISMRASHRIVIPMFGKIYDRPNPTGKVTEIGSQRCLGVSAAAAIALYLSMHQVTGFRNWRGEGKGADR